MNSNRDPIVIIPSFPVYNFEGWLISWSRTKPFLPEPLKKDLTPRKTCGKRFWEAFAKFEKLSSCEQERFRI